MIRHSSSVISLLFLFAAISAGSLWWIDVWFNQPGPLSKPRIVIIEKGVGALDIAEILAANNVVGSAPLFTASVALRKIPSPKTYHPEELLRNLRLDKQ